MTKHTQGPWEYNKSDLGMIRIYKDLPNTGLSQAIADIEINPEKLANARLIAAAPELLEALHDALHNLPKGGECYQIVMKAILKAKGE